MKMKNDRMYRIIKRNQKISQEFVAYTEKRYHGKRIYTNEYIFEKLADKYALSPVTIEAIVFNRIKYKT